jgi:hypothetical protein
MRGYDAGMRGGWGGYGERNAGQRGGNGFHPGDAGAPSGWRPRGWAGPPPGEWDRRPGSGPGFGPRGEYGEAYEEFGGYPGSGRDGIHYGPRSPREDGVPFARRPFMPDEAYRRHPEYRRDVWAREWEEHQRGAGGEELSDREVRDAVYLRMRADPWVDSGRIEVAVEDGVVTLTGEVDDYMEARYAWDDAWEAEGVRGVLTHLTVRADRPHDAHGDMVVQRAEGRTDSALGR